MNEGTSALKRGQGGRLAFEDRFQYHEWTFKQAYISTLLSALSPTLLQHHSYRLSSALRRPSVDHGLAGCFLFRPSFRIFSCSLLRGKLSRQTMCNP